MTLRVALALLLLPLAARAEKLNVVATNPDLAALAREVGGDRVNVISLGRPQEDPHFVQAKPSFIVALNRADLLLKVGMELEQGYLPALLDQTRNRNLRPNSPGRVIASEGVPVLEVPDGPVTRAMGDIHAEGNPHFLADPERGKIAARNIVRALSRAAPQHADEFEANLAKLEARIDGNLAECARLLAPYRGAKVVSYHRSLSYFAERFELDVVNTVEPKPGVSPSPAHIARLIEQMKEEKVKLILLEPWHEKRTPELLAQKTGARVVVLPIQAGDATERYPDVCLHVVRRIVAALGGASR